MIERKEYLQDLISFKDKHIIKVITGIRRCGKSTMFELYQDYLRVSGVKDTQIIGINLEDGEFRMIKDAEKLYSYVADRLTPNQKNYVFLDEVQQASDFQKAVDWLYAKKDVDFYITGSNAFLLSGELATLLSGTFIAERVCFCLSADCQRCGALYELPSEQFFSWNFGTYQKEGYPHLSGRHF